MPEFKRNFLKGRMNKDLDERIVPNGEYRDALNIEVSTSEGSEVGAAQNVKGNLFVSPAAFLGGRISTEMGNSNSANAQTVGSYVSEDSNKIYNFIHKASDFSPSGTYGSYTRYLGIKSDVISEYSPSVSSETGITKSIFTDVFEVRHAPRTINGIDPMADALGNGTPNKITGLATITSSSAFGQSTERPAGIRVGMRVQAIKPDGTDYWGSGNEVVVTKVFTSLVADAGSVEITPVYGAALYTPQLRDLGVVLKFSSPRILNFTPGTSELEANVDGGIFTQTPAGNMITGINITNGLLFWTDGRTEPKRLNIDRFKSGTTDVITHTKLRITDSNGTVEVSDAKETHLTVIRPNPNTPPTVDIMTTTRVGGGIIYMNNPDVPYAPNPNGAVFSDSVASTVLRWENSSALQFSMAEPDAVAGEAWTPGTPFYIKSSVSKVHWKVGDVLEFTGNTSAATARIKVTANFSNAGQYDVFKVEVVDIDVSYLGTEPAESWVAELSEKQTLYPDKFVSFAYRYKYADNEYSCISPYSKPVFSPGFYSYSPKNGFNTGMESSVKSINLKDYVPTHIPKDVAEVELLFKDNAFPSVYSIKSVKRNSDEWSEGGTGTNSGFTSINAEVFGSRLPSIQLDRIWDNVPRKAKAQEFTAGRLMYGNYVENYDLKDGGLQDIKPRINSTINTATHNFNTSSESLNVLYSGQPNGDVSPNQAIGAGTDGGGSYANNESTIPNWPGAVVLKTPEETDPNNRFDNTNFVYQISEEGAYVISANCEFKNARQSFGQQYVIEPARLSIDKCDASGNTIETLIWGNVASSQINYSGLGSSYEDSATSSIIFNSSNWRVLSINQTISTANTNLSVGDYICIKYNATPDFSGVSENASHRYLLSIQNSSFNVTSAPATAFSVVTKQAVESVKSMRTYQVGVVYGDRFGRESSVLVDSDSNLKNSKSTCANKNNIAAKITHNAPYWAEYYKFFVKEVASEYYNIVLHKAYDNNDNVFSWLSFNSADRDKVQVGDYLTQKKKHGNQTPVTNIEARWKVLDISDNVPNGSDGVVIDASEVGASDVIQIEGSDVVGKFFVKIQADSDFTANLGTFTTLTADENINNGALFEVEPSNTAAQSDQLDFFYEASQAYPIKLTEENAEQYIKVGSTVSIYHAFGFNGAANDVNTWNTALNGEVVVTGVVGAKSFGSNQLGGSFGESGFCGVTIGDGGGSDIELPNISVPTGGTIIVRFTNTDGSSTTAYMDGGISGNTIKLKPYTHPTSLYPMIQPIIVLPWFNCYAFGNGVESDRIRDDYNANTIYPYTGGVGKQSGFKASLAHADYKEEVKPNDIIFSQIYNDAVGENRVNQFVLAEPIVKKLNPEYGTVQKLHTRKSDLVALCEHRVLRILANKDALFNADGNAQLLLSTNVLGHVEPFIGEYGISNNPESFAKDEYRLYFTDRYRGAVIRASLDGLTPISDHGMTDWFSDNLEYANALVGSFDSKKNEYNITVHSVTNPLSKKNVYTLSFHEPSNGWVSFKSFIQESGVTLSNNYYTFKNGDMYLHHPETKVNRNLFYSKSTDAVLGTHAVQGKSSVTPLLNDAPSSIKSFSTVSYEGSNAKVVKFTDEDVSGTIYNDGEFYNQTAISGWYAEDIFTDQQEAVVNEFIEKEGKWFNHLDGVATSFTNAADAGTASGNIDLSESSVQGLGSLSIDASLVSGVEPAEGFDIIVTSTSATTWTTTGLSIYNINSISGTSTFTIIPNPGFSLSASSFVTVEGAQGTDLYSSITFADSGVAGTASNTVVATINWFSESVTSDQNIALQITTEAVPSFVNYQALINVSADFDNGETVSFNYDSDVVTIAPEGVVLDGQQQYSLLAFLPVNESTELFTVNITGGGNIVYTSNPGLFFQTSLIDNNEAYSTTYAYTQSNQSIVVSYLAGTEDETISSDNNVFTVLSSGQTAQLSWGSIIWNIDDNAGVYSIPINSNVGVGNVTLSNPADTWITTPINFDNNFAYVEVAENTTGSGRSAMLNLFPPNNNSIPNLQTPQVAVFQAEGEQTDIKAAYNTGWAEGWFTFGPPQEGLTGAFEVQKEGHVDGKLYLATDDQVLTAPNDGDVVVYYDDGTQATHSSPSGWITLSNSYQAPSGLINLAEMSFTVAPNTTTVARSADIIFTHPDSPADSSDTLSITQEAGYNPAVNTIQLKYDASAPLGDAATQVQTLNIEKDASTYTIQILSSEGYENPTLGIGSWGNEPEGPTANNPGGWANLSAIIPTNNPTLIDNYTHHFTFNIEENIGNGDREFKIFCYHDENDTNTPDATLLVVQKPEPVANFVYEGWGTPLPATYSSVDGINVSSTTNSAAASYVKITGFTNDSSQLITLQDGSSTEFYSGSPGWATVGATSTPSNIFPLGTSNTSVAVDENWTSTERRIKLELWHSDKDPAVDPSDDFIKYNQVPTTPQLSLPSFEASQTFNEGFELGAAQIIVASAAATKTETIEYNGAQPTLVPYQDAGGLISSDPSWIAMSSINSTQVSFTINQNITGATRAVEYRMYHENNTNYYTIMIIQWP